MSVLSGGGGGNVLLYFEIMCVFLPSPFPFLSHLVDFSFGGEGGGKAGVLQDNRELMITWIECRGWVDRGEYGWDRLG